MAKKVLIAAGGSGGHIYPAVALAQQLSKVEPQVELQFAGGGLSRNRFFNSEDWPYRDIACGPISGKGILGALKDCCEIAKGVVQSRKLLKDFQPDVIVAFGSYHTLPILTAARMSRCPVVLHEGNAVPGRVNRRFAPYARVTGVNFPEASRYISGRCLEVGFPLREGYTQIFGSQEEARRRFLLHPQRFTFLVFGGSQGASALNSLVSRALNGHLSQRTKQFQVIHVTGRQDAVEAIQKAYEAHDIRAWVGDFIKDMDQAWMAADLAISRAGASSISEQIEFAVPGILIPYPYATDHHQEKNADFFVKTVKGGIKLLESATKPEELASEISKLVAADHAKLEDMRDHIRKFKASQRRRDLCSIVCEVGGIKLR